MKTENARPPNLKVILYLNKNIRNWNKTLQYLPVVLKQKPKTQAPKTIKSFYLKKPYGTGTKLPIPPNSIYRYPFSTLAM